MIRIPVDLKAHPYDVAIAPGLLSQVGPLTTQVCRASRVLVVTQEPIARHHLVTVVESLEAAGLDVHVATVIDGEAAKSLSVLGQLWDRAAGIPLERRDVVVALGGGVVGDLAGFAAATYNRGMAVVQVPTTLLAMTDAAIGGKTAIDLAAGKNLVGAFHQPARVIIDPDTLTTLADRPLREGFGEIVKYGLIRDPDLLELLEDNLDDVLAGDVGLRTEVIRRCVAVKAEVVAADERELGQRAHLNLGHTYAHALETLTGYGEWLHGEAVGVGLLVALRLGELLGRHDDAMRVRTRALLQRIGLPVTAPALNPDEVWQVMGRDKKADGGVRFVVLDGIARPAVIAVDRSQVDQAIADVVGGDI